MNNNESILKALGYEIRQHPGSEEGSKDLFSVLGPSGAVVRGNRKSLLEAAVVGDKYIVSGGEKKWGTLEGLMSSRTSYQGIDLDPEIRDVIQELNKLGYQMSGSCAGHSGSAGFITIRKKKLTSKDRVAIRKVLGSKGATRIGFENAGGDRGWSAVNFEGFNGLGGETTPFWLRG